MDDKHLDHCQTFLALGSGNFEETSTAKTAYTEWDKVWVRNLENIVTVQTESEYTL